MSCSSTTKRPACQGDGWPEANFLCRKRTDPTKTINSSLEKRNICVLKFPLGCLLVPAAWPCSSSHLCHRCVTPVTAREAHSTSWDTTLLIHRGNRGVRHKTHLPQGRNGTLALKCFYFASKNVILGRKRRGSDPLCLDTEAGVGRALARPCYI